MKKILLKIIFYMIMGAIAVAVVNSCTDDTTPLRSIKNKSTIAVLPCDSMSLNARVTPNITAYIDMSKVHNLITAEDLEMLKRLNYRIDSTRCIAIVQNNDKSYSLSTKRYNVDLPIWKWETSVDSAGNITTHQVGKRPANVVYDVDFYLADKGDSTTIGQDFLRRTVLEYRAKTHEIAIHTQVPQGYQEIGDIKSRRSIGDYFGLRSRFYASLKANDIKQWFLLSSLDYGTSIKMPRKAQPKEAQSLRTITQEIDGKTIVCDPKGWIEYGDRAGTHTITFYDDSTLPTEYAFNPLTFFGQDVVIDFLHDKILLHP